MHIPAASLPGRKTLFWMYETMLKIRRFEEELHLLFLQGELLRTLRLYTGQEVVAFARASPEPRPEEALKGVYVAEGGP